MMKEYYLGIDVSKGYADFVVIDNHKNVVLNNFQLDDTFEGHVQLYEVIKMVLAKNSDAVIYAGVESTGGYENNWYQSLHTYREDLNVHVARINPLGVKHYAEAELRRNTTDKISAKNIAEYLLLHSDKVTYEKQDYYASVRRQWKFKELLTKQKTQLSNQLGSLLYITHPQLLQYCRNGYPQWVLKLIKKYPTALHLSRGRVQTIAKIPFITTQKAQLLVDDAKQSVASATDGSMKTLIQHIVGEILHVEQSIKEQSKLMKETCNLPNVGLLNTLIGSDDHSSIGLLIEIGPIERFDSPKKLASFFGLHPVQKTSGDGSKVVRMSKKGRTQPRRILFNVAWAAINHDPHIRAIYNRLVERGMNKMAASGVIMHKTLRIVYGMLKNQQPYQPMIDQANRATVFDRKTSIKNDQNRRYQSLDKKAPISRRQMKKRIEREGSHNDSIIKPGITVPAHNHQNLETNLTQILLNYASRNL